MSPSRTALGVAVTAAALATSIGAHAAPIQPENDDALFKLRYSANGPASAAAREAINRAILPLIDASATDEYTLEPVATVPLAIEQPLPTVSGSIGPIVPSGQETVISTPVQTQVIETFAPAPAPAPVVQTIAQPVDFGPIQTITPVQVEPIVVPSAPIVTTHNAVDCPHLNTVPIEPFLGPVQTVETVEFIDSAPIIQSAPQVVTCPTPAPVVQPTTTVINITPPAQQAAPVFQAPVPQVVDSGAVSYTHLTLPTNREV